MDCRRGLSNASTMRLIGDIVYNRPKYKQTIRKFWDEIHPSGRFGKMGVALVTVAKGCTIGQAVFKWTPYRCLALGRERQDERTFVNQMMMVTGS